MRTAETQDALTALTRLEEQYLRADRTHEAQTLGKLLEGLSGTSQAPAEESVTAQKSATAEKWVAARAEAPGANWRTTALSVLIGLYMFNLALILLPPSLPRDRFLMPMKPFLGALGFWQAWNVFSPNIRDENFHLSAIVVFADGTSVIWDFPRQEKLSGLEQMRAERFRKWANDRVRYSEYRFLLPDTARFIARLHNTSANPVTRVTLMRSSAKIPAPADGASKLPFHNNVMSFYSFQFAPEDLK